MATMTVHDANSQRAPGSAGSTGKGGSNGIGHGRRSGRGSSRRIGGRGGRFVRSGRGATCRVWATDAQRFGGLVRRKKSHTGRSEYEGPFKSCGRRAQERVPKRERVEDVRIEYDLERCGDHSDRAPLLHLVLVTTELLGQLGQVAKGVFSLTVPLLPEREHVFDSESAVLPCLRVRDATFIE